MFSLRYANQALNPRLWLMRLFGLIQGKRVIALRSDPEACAKVLISSNKKGRFIEQLIACPAWLPVHSVESVDGDEWVYLAKQFREIYGQLDWENRLSLITQRQVMRFKDKVLDGEQVSRLTANLFFDLVFERDMTQAEEDLFYQASLEWRKELAMKSPGDQTLKQEFWSCLGALIENSRFSTQLHAHREQRDLFLSTFAQPLFLSPQINFSDIFAAVFTQFEQDPELFTQALQAAKNSDFEFLRNICLETIRLQHPFPILEREITSDLVLGQKKLKPGDQVFIMLDDFDQDPEFNPERWAAGGKNPYKMMPFGAGPRICIGKNLAQKLLGEFLAEVLNQFDILQIKPSKNHLYSGRNNDHKDGIDTLFYQIRVFSKALWNSRQSSCPMSLSPVPDKVSRERARIDSAVAPCKS